MPRMFNPAATDATTHVPPGTYKGQVVNCIYKEGKRGRFFKVWVEVQEDTDHTGSRVEGILSTSDAALWKLSQFCTAIRYLEPFDLDGECEEVCEGAKGQGVVIELEDDEWDGKVRSNIARWLPSDAEINKAFGEATADGEAIDDIPF